MPRLCIHGCEFVQEDSRVEGCIFHMVLSSGMSLFVVIRLQLLPSRWLSLRSGLALAFS